VNGLHVACGGSVEYLPHTATMLHSVLAQRDGLSVHVYHLHGPALPDKAARRLTEMVERNGGTISLVQIEDRDVADLPEIVSRAGDWNSSAVAGMWYRTFLPELLPDVERVLYLDADTVAIDSLRALWATELGDAYVGAVTNVWEPWNASYPESLGLSRPYFNSGVLLMNLELMRRDDCIGRIVRYGREHPDGLPWGDQDVLNVVLGERRVELHPRWNCMNSVLNFAWAAEVFGAAAVDEARASPGIRHFEGPSINKPWNVLCPWEGREVYRRHRRQTPWRWYMPEGVTPHNLLAYARILRHRFRP
jgi:lipopolysaccharide biosynthesis glycosyltransferase